MLALRFIVKLVWRLISAFYFPLHFAVGSFYVAALVLGEQMDCRSLCDFPENCADNNTLMTFDFFLYAGVGLAFLALVLPAIIFYRERKMVRTSIFD